MKHFSFANALAFYIVSWLFLLFTLAIMLPEKFASNPIVTQFTTMASNLLSFIVGYYFGGMNKTKTGEAPGTTTVDFSATATTNVDDENKAAKTT